MLEVRRRASNYASLVSIRIFVDGDKPASVVNGATVRVPVAPGRHAVRVKCYFNWSAELLVDVAIGQRVVIDCEIRGQYPHYGHMYLRQVV